MNVVPKEMIIVHAMRNMTANVVPKEMIIVRNMSANVITREMTKNIMGIKINAIVDMGKMSIVIVMTKRNKSVIAMIRREKIEIVIVTKKKTNVDVRIKYIMSLINVPILVMNYFPIYKKNIMLL